MSQDASRYEWGDPPARSAAPAPVVEDKRIEGLTKRIEKLERENRRWGVIVAFVMAGFSVLILLIARSSKTTSEVVARRIAVTDANGLQRAVLEAADTGAPQLTFLDIKGRVRLKIGMPNGDAPEITLNGLNEKALLSLAATPTSGMLSLLDREEKRRALIVVDGEGKVAFKVLSSDGRRNAEFWEDEDGVGGLTFWDRAGKERVGLGVSGDYSLLRLAGGPSGAAVSTLSVGKEGFPKLSLVDRDLATKVLVTIGADGTPRLTLAEKKGFAAVLQTQRILLGKDQAVIWAAP